MHLSTLLIRPNQILIFLGDGAGGVSLRHLEAQLSSVPAISTFAQTIAFHDMDQDGNEDLIGLSLNTSAVAVFSGDGAGSFSELDGQPILFLQQCCVPSS